MPAAQKKPAGQRYWISKLPSPGQKLPAGQASLTAALMTAGQTTVVLVDAQLKPKQSSMLSLSESRPPIAALEAVHLESALAAVLENLYVLSSVSGQGSSQSVSLDLVHGQ
jgi:hypothetical protein